MKAMPRGIVFVLLILGASPAAAQNRTAADSDLARSTGHWTASGVSFQSGGAAHPFAVQFQRAGDHLQATLPAELKLAGGQVYNLARAAASVFRHVDDAGRIVEFTLTGSNHASLLITGSGGDGRITWQLTRDADSAFAATQTRGQAVMGVDQYTSAHIFEDVSDGGRIILERDDPRDTAGIAMIRAHMRSIAAAFRAGDFSQPFQVHAQSVPGTAVMAARHSAIHYAAVDRPRGAEVRLRSSDTVAIAAIHQFLSFQRGAHHAAGHEGP